MVALSLTCPMPLTTALQEGRRPVRGLDKCGRLEGGGGGQREEIFKIK